MALHDDGGYAGNVGRPLGEIFIAPSYGITFYNKMISDPLTEVGLSSVVPVLYEYTEELGDINLQYSRILHFSVTEGSTGKVLQEDVYVPYINEEVMSGSKTTFTTKPIVEVMNPRFVQVSENIFMMYFFTNFTSSSLPDGNTYNDDPQYLRRMVEFSTNEPDQLDGKSPPGLSDPLPNDRNYYVDDAPIDETPKTAFVSSLLRVLPMDIMGSSSASSDDVRMYIVCEKPIIITWVGHRFGLDNHPPLLANTTQSVEWATDKIASDSLDEDAVNASPPRQIPYHHLISRINTVMYSGYSGINFYTQPITNVYDQALDHMFEIEGSASRNFNIYAQGRKLKSLGVQQKNKTELGGSNYDPFKRHFGVFEIDMGDFRSFSSSSTSDPPSYDVDIPASINLTGDDKPEFWVYYWKTCGSSSGSPSGGTITVDFTSDGSWYGTACIDGIEMYAKLEERPYGYYQNERVKFWLTFGPLTIMDIELDIVWQGYKVSDIDGDGSYIRYYSLGDNTPETITVSET